MTVKILMETLNFLVHLNPNLKDAKIVLRLSEEDITTTEESEKDSNIVEIFPEFVKPSILTFSIDK